jgi:hypothetical protein
MTMFELDHLFLWASVGGPEADRLVAFGLTEGEPNTHPGQGTACRRFFFRNAFLEVVWAHDPIEAQAEGTHATGLWPRWCGRARATSPFGLCLRPARPGGAVPFPAWEYRPPYLPAPLVIHVGQGVPASEPWWFYLSFGRRPDDGGWRRPQPLDHAAGFREVTAVRLTGPGLANPSEVAQAVAGSWAVTLAGAPEPVAEVTFDGGGQGREADFRPDLPLVLRW